MYSADPDRIARLRIMSSFGFGEPRTATMPGLNGKVSELVALTGQLRLADYDSILRHRAQLFAHYRAALPELQFQPEVPGSQAHQFVPALLPSAVRGRRAPAWVSTIGRAVMEPAPSASETPSPSTPAPVSPSSSEP